MKLSGIYQIQSNCKSQRLYVGSAINISSRWKTHLWELKNGRHGNSRLQRHYNKYGEADLQFSILIGCEKSELIEKEQFFIDSLNPWFNICKKAGSKIGVSCKKKTRNKISKANKGKKKSQEFIDNLKKRVPWNKGKKGLQKGWNKGLSKEQQPRFGKKDSKETIEKRAKSITGRAVSEKTLAILSVNWGKPQSDESNKKKGDHARGKTQSKEQVRKRMASTKKTNELKKVA
jgi:group I intron endonuclease